MLVVYDPKTNVWSADYPDFNIYIAGSFRQIKSRDEKLRADLIKRQQAAQAQANAVNVPSSSGIFAGRESRDGKGGGTDFGRGFGGGRSGGGSGGSSGSGCDPRDRSCSAGKW